MAAVTVRTFRDLSEALVAKSVLESASIECFLSDENTIRMDWLWSKALGGIKLQVREEDLAAAADLLDQEVSKKFEVEGVGESVATQCPHCQSADIRFGERVKRLGFASLLVGVPLPHWPKRIEMQWVWS